MHQNELYHHGVKGQKWGVRRYQNYDGTLVKKGKEFVKNHKKLVITGAALAGTAIAAVGGVHIADVFMDGKVKEFIDELIDDTFFNSNLNDAIKDVTSDIQGLIDPHSNDLHQVEHPNTTATGMTTPMYGVQEAPSTLGIPVPSHDTVSSHTSGLHTRRPVRHLPRIVVKDGLTADSIHKMKNLEKYRELLKAHVDPQKMQNLLNSLKSK